MALNLHRAACPSAARAIGAFARLLTPMLLVAEPAPAAAQVSAAEAHWMDGRYDEAKAAYERALRRDLASVPALYRLAVLAAWRSDLDSAAALARQARLLNPLDPDIRVLQAQFRAWGGDFDGAVLAYDSVIATHPRHLDAHLGLARVHYWARRGGAAQHAVARALSIDSTSADARTLQSELRRAFRASISAVAGWWTDSDDNTSWSETLILTAPLSDAVRAFVVGGAQQSSDPVRNARMVRGEIGADWATRYVTLHAAGGARRLSIRDDDERTEATVRGGLSARRAAVWLSIGFAHVPFDETAQLISRALDIDVLEGAAEVTLRHGLVLGLGGGGAWVSDGNDRYAVTASLTQTVARRFFVGTYGRQVGYEFQGSGYFSPNRFRLAEGRAGWIYASPVWDVRVSGGVGIQQAFEAADVQAEWHTELRAAHKWPRVSIEIFGNVTNSLERSTTGAYRSGAAGVRVVVGL